MGQVEYEEEGNDTHIRRGSKTGRYNVVEDDAELEQPSDDEKHTKAMSNNMNQESGNKRHSSSSNSSSSIDNKDEKKKARRQTKSSTNRPAGPGIGAFFPTLDRYPQQSGLVKILVEGDTWEGVWLGGVCSREG